MIDMYCQLNVTDKELALLAEAAEFRIKWFLEQVAKAGKDYDGEYIDGWDSNDIALLNLTLQTLKKVQQSRGWGPVSDPQAPPSA